MKKRSLAFLSLLILLCGMLTGCGTVSKNDRLSIICTIFPQYDWTREILGDHAEEVDLTLLMDNGADLHNYQATTEDILLISNCDLFVYIGGESDSWTSDVLKNKQNSARKEIALLSVIDAEEAEHVEGMEEHEHEEGEDHHEYDEHLWLSLSAAKKGVNEIAAKLSVLDPTNADDYLANAAAYCDKLEKLDDQYEADRESAQRDTLLFADRFPFLYLTEDYDLNYYAAFSGCSAETEASFETLAFLAQKVDELALPVVMVTETADQSLAKTVISSTTSKDQKILVLDSMQSVTKKRIDNGETYLSIMESNRKIIYEALH